MEKIVLIAGKGRLPGIWTKRAAQKGHRVVACPIIEEQTSGLKDYAAEIKDINLGALGELINFLQQKNVKKIIMLGKVEKSRLFNNFEPDLMMQKLMASLPEFSNEIILKKLMDFFENKGFEVLPQTTFMEKLLPGRGILTTGEPSDSLKQDMEYGFSLAQKVGELDIGQTVLVKNRSVLAVEAVEGTDQTILRAGEYGGSGAVMAKVTRPEQDLRFDLPVVGLETVKKLAEIKASGLILEAQKTFLLDQKEFISRAEQAGITVAAREIKER